MAICKYCNDEFSDERLEAGYDYCMSETCQKIGLDISEREFRKQYTPALLHKCNYFWVKKEELSLLNTRADIIAGYGDQNE
jgi:hypothetical protein